MTVPFWSSSFWLQLGLFSMASIIGAVGLTMLVGTAGQLSLAHAFFVAIGAYGYAYLAGDPDAPGEISGLGLPPVVALVGAVLLAGLAGAAFSPIAGRLRGIYLGLASLGLVFIGQHVLVNVTSVTGGFNGRDAEPFRLLGFGFSNSDPDYLAVLGVEFEMLHRLWFLGLVLVAVAVVFARNLVDSRQGRAWTLVRDSEPAAGSMGIGVTRAKATVFTVSSMYAGLGGVLMALAFGRIVPESFDLLLSIDFLVMIVIGGVGSVGGAAAGAVFVTALPLVLDRYSGALPFLAETGTTGFGAPHLSRVLYGLAIVCVLLFAPGGLAGIGARLGRARRGRSTPMGGEEGGAPSGASQGEPTAPTVNRSVEETTP
ncbi:MAG: branched-chain amino acid ABC transporter permease [Actinomycetota bacterium]|nr:branched-chain amino acid ABC transporter permease [Actinomycetota bacterium]